ncbi:MAG TPA: hypothetical protein VGO40_21125, partial [Longimicrobium sp.]|nr:hypothetical protein [Longimicrobium sp.]
TIVIPTLGGGASIQVVFAWAPPAPGTNLAADDHFCLLVRLDTEADPASVGAGGWSAITADNNVALRNTHVQNLGDGDSADTSFYVTGTGRGDSLVVTRALAAGDLLLTLPARTVPVRDRRLIEVRAAGGAMPASRAGCVAGFRRLLARGLGLRSALPAPPGGAPDDLRSTYRGDDVWRRTGIEGAAAVEFADGVARVSSQGAERLRLPQVALAEGERVPVRLAVRGAQPAGERRFVHVAQYAGGELVGGVTLELRS